MATIGDVATVVSLIGKAIKAATDAQMLKKEFKELADYLELVGRQLEMLDDGELDDAAMEAFQKMKEVLFQCHDLAASCQRRRTIYLVFNGKRIQNQIRGAQEKLTKYLTLIPLIHFTQVFRQFKEERKMNENLRKHARDESEIPETIAEFTDNKSQTDACLFTYEQIVKMTHNFERIIGRGGSGRVYYGLLEDGTEVAIKLWTHSTSQGEKEFLAELRTLTKVCHKNLVSLIGYSRSGSFLAIVYEYMPQGSLEGHLRGKVGYPVLTWTQRLQIAYQAAQGLDYLHMGCDPPIVHRDVTSSNILLGANLEAKITDFGISRAWDSKDTYVSTSVIGTPGYLDPEYYSTFHLSKATDVYSFGIILLEMITGRPPIIRGPEVQHIVDWISLRIASEVDYVDRRLNECYDSSSMWKVLQLAMSCTNSLASRRPRMAEVAIQLKEIIEMKPVKQMTEDMNSEGIEIEEVEEAFVTSIARADRPVCTHQLSANLFTSWTHNAPGRRFWGCKHWKTAGDCGFFKWHDSVREGVVIEQMDFLVDQRDELAEEMKMMDEGNAILLSKLKALEEKIAERKRSKEALEMKSECI